MEQDYSYSYNEHNRELTVYEGTRILATISDVDESNAEYMFAEVLFESRGI